MRWLTEEIRIKKNILEKLWATKTGHAGKVTEDSYPHEQSGQLEKARKNVTYPEVLAARRTKGARRGRRGFLSRG